MKQTGGRRVAWMVVKRESAGSHKGVVQKMTAFRVKHRNSG
ncbi:MAG: hypothetical protein PHN79_07365 [Methanoregula sp.]|nr:hypothetical protein [Methanoregula sp.]